MLSPEAQPNLGVQQQQQHQCVVLSFASFGSASDLLNNNLITCLFLKCYFLLG